MTNFSGKNLNVGTDGPEGGGMDSRRTDQVAEVSAKYQANTLENAVPAGYKHTEVGVIPEDWVVCTIAEKHILATGYTPPTSSPKNYSGDFLFVSPADLGEHKYIFKTEKSLSDAGTRLARKYPKGSTLFTCIGSTIGKTGLATKELSSNQQINAVFPNGECDDEFTYYALTYIAPKVKLLAGQQAVPLINKTEFGETLYCLPRNLKEQTAIANALSDIDALISELEKLITKKQAVKTATMQQLLTGRTRLPQFSLREDGTPKGTKTSELGEIPEDWEAVALKELLKDSPKYGINAPAVPLEGKLPVYIRITDISEDGYFKPTEKVGVESPFSDLYQLADGDLVLARTGASVGKSYLYRPEDGVLVYAGFLIKVTPEQSKLDPKFLFQYLQTERYWSWVTVNSMRSGQPGINGNEYGSLMLPWPEKEEQTAIATILSDMDTEIQALEQRLSKTRQIKQGMMQELLTGKTRLIQGGADD